MAGGPRGATQELLLHARAQALVQAVASATGVAGALLVTRDGICLASEGTRPRRAELAAAMGAAILSAAESLGSELAVASKTTTFRIFAGGRVINGAGAEPALVMLTVLDEGADPDKSAAAVASILARAGSDHG